MQLTENHIVNVDEQLRNLVATACQYPPGHLQRQQCLTKIVRLVTQSRKLWYEKNPDYEDALQQTWLYFCQNICEAGTGEQYAPQRSSVITWLNHYLKWRLQDVRTFQQKQHHRLISGTAAGVPNKGNIDMADLTAPPDVPPILEETRRWVLADPTGELRNTHLQHRVDITCQLLILRRLPPETGWEQLSTEFGVTISTLSSFYQRQCLPRLRNFGEKQGYL